MLASVLGRNVSLGLPEIVTFPEFVPCCFSHPARLPPAISEHIQRVFADDSPVPPNST